MAEIVDLVPDQIAAAGAVLARAFFDDGLARLMYPDDEERKRLTPWHFTALVRYGALFGRVLTTPGQPLGAAIWLPPGEPDMTEERMAAAGMDASVAMLGAEAFGRFAAAMEQIAPHREQAVPDPHWYLALIGVDPDHAGKGIGSALLQPVFADADRDGLACYLETAEAANVAFYEARGFAVTRYGTVSGTSVDYWTMLREPA